MLILRLLLGKDVKLFEVLEKDDEEETGEEYEKEEDPTESDA
jgi:hypothetical protein